MGIENKVPDSRSAAQIECHQHYDDASGYPRFAPVQDREDRLGVLHPGGDRDSDCQDIVHKERRRNGESCIGPEVDGSHLVVAAAGRIRMHVLPVGRYDDQHHDGDQDCDLPGEGVRDKPGQ